MTVRVARQVCVVTGYIPIPGHPRPKDEYLALGHRLLDAIGAFESATSDGPRFACYGGDVGDTWLHRAVRARPSMPIHSAGDNPAKNTLAYHCVQHQKTAWLAEAARTTLTSDVFVWIDYGIFHQLGITAEVIRAFLDHAAGETGVAIPGALDPQIVGVQHPCWRFCGSTLVCHRDHIDAFDQAVRDEAMRLLTQGNHVTWEVNTWARVELLQANLYRASPGSGLPIRWYRGDHNETQFTGYTPPEAR